jgi:hypothetical protein
MTIGIKAPELKLIITRPTEQQQQQQQQTRAFLFLCVVPACGFYFNHLCFFGVFLCPRPPSLQATRTMLILTAMRLICIFHKVNW